MALRLEDQFRNVLANTVAVYLSGTGGTAGSIAGGTSGSGATLKVYGGTQPTTGGGTSGTQEILVRIDGISWNAASNGTATIAASKTGTAGTAGTPKWARLSGTNGTGYILDGVCGTAATADFVIDVAGIVAAGVITLSAATIVQPAS